MACDSDDNPFAMGIDSRANARTVTSPYEQVRIVVDVGLAASLLIITSPILLIAMVMVRVSSRGPALYMQRRLGLRGRVFTIYKIRTMYQDSERHTGAVWTVPGDKRVTPVGRFLRWSHLDELPQLANILRGEMSLVGPRPERPEIVPQLERALPRYRQRLLVRPGLTALAQVLQAPDTHLRTVRRKLKYDLHYIRHRSLWLDFRILMATVFHLLRVAPESFARILRFPYKAQGRQKVSSLQHDEIAAGSQVQPAYIN
jgi:lipopolysaccharide/colanic/teichoic acid biosynthesis glycosyltransferase